MASMDAAVLHGVNDLRVERVPAPNRPGPDDVLIAMRAVGLCGSDVHYWHEGRIGPYVVTKPIILGHECSGEVVEVGQRVSHLRPGDRVALEPGVPCRHCRYCVTGRYESLPAHAFLRHAADRRRAGAARRASRGSHLQTARLHDIRRGRHVGAVIRWHLRLSPCRRRAWEERSHPGSRPGRPPVFARGTGSRGHGNLRDRCQGRPAIQSGRVRRHRRLPRGRCCCPGHAARGDQREGTDIVLECSGAPSAVRQSVDLVRRGGTVVWVGMGPESFEFPTLTIGMKELDVKGLFRYAHTWPTAIELISSGRIDVKPLVTHRFPLTDVVEAFELTRTGADGADQGGGYSTGVTSGRRTDHPCRRRLLYPLLTAIARWCSRTAGRAQRWRRIHARSPGCRSDRRPGSSTGPDPVALPASRHR